MTGSKRVCLVGAISGVCLGIAGLWYCSLAVRGQPSSVPPRERDVSEPRKAVASKTPQRDEGSGQIKPKMKPPPLIPFGSISAKPAINKINEGDSLDITLTIRNEAPESLLAVSDPDVWMGSLGFRVIKVGAEHEKPFETEMKTAYTNGQFEIAGGASRALPILLLEGYTPPGGLFWLEPGQYKVQVAYYPQPRGGALTRRIGDGQIDLSEIIWA